MTADTSDATTDQTKGFLEVLNQVGTSTLNTTLPITGIDDANLENFTQSRGKGIDGDQ